MSIRGLAAAVAAMFCSGLPLSAQAVDTASPAPPLRHILAIDYSRLKPFRRSYEIVLTTGDSTTVIGRRDLSLEETALPDSAPGWLMVESRSGTVPSLDSIFLADDLRPVRWRATLGVSRLALEFSADSVTGDVRVGNAGGRVDAEIPPDLVVSASELEVLAPLLPLTAMWADSVHALTVTFAGAAVEPVELAVMAEDVVPAGSVSRPAWILSLRSGTRETRLWVDRDSGDVLRTQQLLPARVGTSLEYRALGAPAP